MTGLESHITQWLAKKGPGKFPKVIAIEQDPPSITLDSHMCACFLVCRLYQHIHTGKLLQGCYQCLSTRVPPNQPICFAPRQPAAPLFLPMAQGTLVILLAVMYRMATSVQLGVGCPFRELLNFLMPPKASAQSWWRLETDNNMTELKRPLDDHIYIGDKISLVLWTTLLQFQIQHGDDALWV